MSQQYQIKRVTSTVPNEWDGATNWVDVELPSGRTTSFNLYGPRLSMGQLIGAEVNWSALGASSLADAAGFAEALADCARAAAMLEGPRAPKG